MTDIVKDLREVAATEPDSDTVREGWLCDRIGDAADEIERLRNWVFCPEHGPNCGAAACCCVDRHQPGLAGWERTEPGLVVPA